MTGRFVLQVRFNTGVAGRVNFYKFRTRARFIQVRDELSAWCREVGVADDVLEPLVWDVVALIDAPAVELAAVLRQRVPPLSVALDKKSAKALAERLKVAATRGEVRFIRR